MYIKYEYQKVGCSLPGHTNSINYFAIKNNILASASDDHNIILWDIETGKPLYSFFGSQEVLAGEHPTYATEYNYSGSKTTFLPGFLYP